MRRLEGSVTPLSTTQKTVAAWAQLSQSVHPSQCTGVTHAALAAAYARNGANSQPAGWARAPRTGSATWPAISAAVSAVIHTRLPGRNPPRQSVVHAMLAARSATRAPSKAAGLHVGPRLMGAPRRRRPRTGAP